MVGLYLTREEIEYLGSQYPQMSFRPKGSDSKGPTGGGGGTAADIPSGGTGPSCEEDRTASKHYVFPPCSAKKSVEDLRFCLETMINFKDLSLPIVAAEIEDGVLHGETRLPFKKLRVHLESLTIQTEGIEIVTKLWAGIKALAEAGMYHSDINIDNTFVVGTRNTRIAFAGFQKSHSFLWAHAKNERNQTSEMLALLMTGLLTSVWPGRLDILKDMLRNRAFNEVKPKRGEYEALLAFCLKNRKYAVGTSAWIWPESTEQTSVSSFVANSQRISEDSRKKAQVMLENSVMLWPGCQKRINSFGLKNSKLQCWANSALQMLYRDDCVRGSVMHSSGVPRSPELEVLRKIFEVFAAESAKKVKDVQDNVNRLQERYKNVRQKNEEQDASEFLDYILASVSEGAQVTDSRICFFETLKSTKTDPPEEKVSTEIQFLNSLEVFPRRKLSAAFAMYEKTTHTLEVPVHGFKESVKTFMPILNDKIYVQVNPAKVKGGRIAIEERLLLWDAWFKLDSAMLNLPNHYVFFDFNEGKMYNDAEVTKLDVTKEDGVVDFRFQYGRTWYSLQGRARLLRYRREPK
jgi:hypothetical protein